MNELLIMQQFPKIGMLIKREINRKISVQKYRKTDKGKKAHARAMRKWRAKKRAKSLSPDKKNVVEVDHPQSD
jgi:hypothetical protein